MRSAGVGAAPGAEPPRQGSVLEEADHMVCGRSCLLVRSLGLISTGLATVAVARMFGSAEIGELLLWMTGAWLAWAPIIVIKLRDWARDGSMTMLREPEEGARRGGAALV